MTELRIAAFQTVTPYEGARNVVCWNHTWVNHVPQARRSDPEFLDRTLKTLENPDIIVQGTTNPAYVIFVNTNIVSSGKGAPFAVVVDPAGDPLPAVTSMSFRRELRSLTTVTVLWRKER